LSKDIQLRIHQDEHNTFSKLSYSAVMYLNDNYEGGEICFLKDFSSDFDFPLYEKEMNGLEYKPDKGDLVIFKSDTWHGGTKIENGNRYSIIFWSTEQEEYQFKGFDSDNVWSPDWKESLNKNN
jgi:predicted 2-oxoglutarate/Fe(II)-dependent dioxygenase YbiX